MRQRLKKILKRIFRKPSDAVVMGNSLVSADTILGDYTYVGYNCCITKAQIGRYVSIANNVSIGQGEHNYQDISTSSVFYDDAYAKLTQGDCIIGNDVWIGVDSIIRRGVRIGDGAVIGANSFVNSDVPDFAIVVGNPAKLIKYRFEPQKIEHIKSSRWWDLDLQSAKLKLALMKESLK